MRLNMSEPLSIGVFKGYNFHEWMLISVGTYSCTSNLTLLNIRCYDATSSSRVVVVMLISPGLHEDRREHAVGELDLDSTNVVVAQNLYLSNANIREHARVNLSFLGPLKLELVCVRFDIANVHSCQLWKRYSYRKRNFLSRIACLSLNTFV